MSEEFSVLAQWMAGVLAGGGGFLAVLKLWFDRRDKTRLYEIEEVDRLKERNIMLQARVDLLETEKADLVEENNELTKDIGLKEVRIAHLESRMKSLERTVETVKNSLGLLEASWIEEHPDWDKPDSE